MLPGKKIPRYQLFVRAGVYAYMDATLLCSRILSLSTALKFIRKKKICLPAAVSVHHKKSCTLRDGVVVLPTKSIVVFLDFLDAVGVTYIMNQRKATLFCAEM